MFLMFCLLANYANSIFQNKIYVWIFFSVLEKVSELIMKAFIATNSGYGLVTLLDM